MFENLTNSVSRAIKNLKGQGKITELNISATIKDIRRALVSADVNYKIAKELTERIKKNALGENVLTSVSPGQLLTKIVSDELTKLMGEDTKEINLSGNPSVVLVVGLQGSGKTTFVGKLAHKLKNQSKKVLIVACDVYRPAAIEQINKLGHQIEVEVYSEKDNSNVLNISKNALEYAKSNKINVVIIDTAGRMSIDDEMMNEVQNLKESVLPSETLFVVDSMTGQDAVNTAQAFDKKLNFDGVVLTKLDGDNRGGAAISIKTVVNKPIKYISTGEKMRDLDIFHPDRMAKRILGMGDVISVVERAQQVYEEEEARKLSKKIRKNKFDYSDFLFQLKQLKKMGSLKDIVSMIPGLKDKAQGMEINDETFKPFETMIFSMTPYEKSNPDIIDKSRRERIARGSGIGINKINEMIKHFEEMRKVMKKASKGGIKNALESFNFKF